MGDWTFFSNYGHVLVCLARNSDARLRDVAQEVGITERAVQKIVRDLQNAEFLVVTKQGRRNRYRINRRKALRHDLESHVTVGKLLRLVAGAPLPERAPELLDALEVSSEPEADLMPSEKPAEPVAKPPREEEPKKGPVDTRQQGDLF